MGTLLFLTCPPAWTWLTPSSGRHLPPSLAPGCGGQAAGTDLSNESIQTPNRNDPMLIRHTQTNDQANGERYRAEPSQLSQVMGTGVSLSIGSVQDVRGITPSNTLPPHSLELDGCDDGTMKGPTGSGCFGGRDSMVRPARVGICAASRMEEWTEWSLWGQHHGPRSQEKEMCALAWGGDSTLVAAPRASALVAGPNRRGESTALL